MWQAILFSIETKEFVWKKNQTPVGLIWNTNVANFSLFSNTTVTVITSCENTPQFEIDKN